tara:strand:+ start:20101 stop:21108 length:1008 start_codon:yes stop_codon:yes gene_type:complete
MSLNSFLKQLSTGDEIRDFSHASKMFVDGGMRLAPKSGFSYHVFFDITPDISKRFQSTSIIEAGMLVKSVDLPSYQIDIKRHNAYNRVNLAQSKINYNPVNVVFHDDMANVVRELWYEYYSYYYNDAKHPESTYTGLHKYSARQTAEWGFNSAATLPFFSAIRIYQLHKKQFSEYTLINPIISDWMHGQQVAGASDPVEHKMTVQFETVKYRKGYVSENTVKGFGELHYDQTPSPLTPAGGGTQSIVGPGGLLETVSSISTDLADGNLLGAGLTAVLTAENFKGADFKQIAKSEFKAGLNDILRGKDPTQRFYMPTNTNSKTAPATLSKQFPDNT